MLDQQEALDEFNRRKPLYERANTSVRAILEGLLHDLRAQYGFAEGFQVIGEPKDFESFYRKATAKYESATVAKAFEDVTDLSRLRVICHTLDDCNQLLEMLRKQDVLFVDETSIKNYIENPSPTGYRAIHVDVSIEVQSGAKRESIPVEIQIRTAIQEAWGHFTHSDFYKYAGDTPLIRDLMCEFSDLLYWSDKHADRLIKEMVMARNAATGEDAQPSR